MGQYGRPNLALAGLLVFIWSMHLSTISTDTSIFAVNERFY